ncbi:MAG: Mur ligase family protein [Microscillaceae bacterium]|jgi:UDP-N-acetylmuramate: L-alanyl-gamma-D-glutamyl-meso-diaminopimelate ligase|nr:Mur ligase family protein [Microscillaceae bacterium]
MVNSKRIHFIAIGGSVMHSLAIDAHRKGYEVSGSDDEIFEPSKTRLANAGLLPNEYGWFPERITPDLSAVIVGMHARADNPELLKAQELGIKIYSFPEYIYQLSEDKQRVVIGGSHGKTTVTAIILHVLESLKRKFDYLVGASIPGFENFVRISDDAPLIIIEGDEYLTAPFDPTPKFLHYKHHIGVITGVAWDHMNVYKTFEDYIEQFEKFADATPKAGTLVYSQDDLVASVIGANERADVLQIPYQAHPHVIVDGTTFLTIKGERIAIQIFGEHNLKNIMAAKHVCQRIGVSDEAFYKVITTFKGASKRLEKVIERDDFTFYKDFAHSPSKLLATTMAVKKQFIERKLIACMELHTFSSLNKDFLPQYNETFESADQAIVYYNPHSFSLKRLEPLNPNEVVEAFNHDNLKVFDDSQKLREYLLSLNWHNKNLLMMSSGNFDNLDFAELGKAIVEKL